MANEDTRPETEKPEAGTVPPADPTPKVAPSDTKDQDPPRLTTPAEPHAVPPARPVFLPLLLGGIVAAVLGFGLARVIPGGWPVQDMSPLRAEIQRQAQEITSLRDRLGAMSTPDLRPLEDRIAALENQPVSPADLQSQIEELRSRIGDGAIGADLQAVIDRTEQELADARAQAENLRQAAQDTARKAGVSAALSRIAGALDSGTPYGAALQDLRDAGAEVPQPLADGADGVASVPALQAAFAPAARDALDESLKVDGGEGFGNRVGSFLRAQTGARSLTPREGNDPDAILSRAEAAVQSGDLRAALDEIGALPLEGQAALSDWRADVETRLGAIDALGQMNAGTR